jgi:hypothetical protein
LNEPPESVLVASDCSPSAPQLVSTDATVSAPGSLIE